MSHSNAVMGSWGSAVKTSASYNWRNSRPNFHYNSGPTFNRTVNAKGPQGRPKPAKAWVTRIKWRILRIQGGFVTFGGRQRLHILHKVLFTETECLVVSSDFKMPDENQILLKVPRHHNMYSFDMKTPTPAKGFACLIAKATSDESKLWHRSVLGKFDGKNLMKDSSVDKPNVKGNQANPHAGASELTNSAGTLQTPSFNCLEEEKDEDECLLLYFNGEGLLRKKLNQVKSSHQFKERNDLTELQQEKKASSTDTSEDNPKIQAFRRELEEIALKHLGKVSENTTTSTTSVNTGSEPVNTGSFDPDDSPIPELEIFHKSETEIFDEASY
ncbi:hypothetical protein Tco_0085944 [Tanacetum coccineum]